MSYIICKVEDELYAYPRPARNSKWGQYYLPKQFVGFLDTTAEKIRADLNASGKTLTGINFVCLIAYFKYPKATPKKNLIDNAYCEKNSDGDNMLKTVVDAINRATNNAELSDDRRIVYKVVEKRFTTGNPKFVFAFGNLNPEVQ